METQPRPMLRVRQPSLPNSRTSPGGLPRPTFEQEHSASRRPFSPRAESTDDLLSAFSDWLEDQLDGYGLDAVLYSRCILSILRQPPEQLEDEEPGFMEGVFALELDECHGNGPQDRRELAIANILLSVHQDDKGLAKSFASEILQRYARLEEADANRKPNESIDSGVCPSPDESFQNYDEAFPPLSTPAAGACEHEIEYITAFAATSEQPWRWVAAPGHVSPPFWWCEGDATPRKRLRKDSDGGSGDGGTSTVDSVAPAASARRPSGGQQPTLVLGRHGSAFGRPLRSCPDMSGRLTVPYMRGSGMAFPPNQKPPFTALGHSPQFIVPKCYKVAVAPIPRVPRRVSFEANLSETLQSGKEEGLATSLFTTWMTFNYKGAGNLQQPPFWSPNHIQDFLPSRLSSGTSVEACFWNARLSAACTGPGWRRPVPGPIGTAGPTAMDLTPDSMSAFGERNSIIGEITCTEASLYAEAVAAAVGVSPSQKSAESQRNGTEESMFDAPQFILQVINEDDSIEVEDDLGKTLPLEIPKPGEEMVELQHSLNDLLADRPGLNVNETSASLAKGPAAEFTFVPGRERLDRFYDTLQPTSFCMPKLDTSTGGSQVGSFDLSGSGAAGQSKYYMPVGSLGSQASGSGPSQLLTLASSHSASKLSPFNKGGLTLATAEKGKPGPVATATESSPSIPVTRGHGHLPVPISPKTHFIPIRAESMYEAYFPRPQFDETTEEYLQYAAALEGYHVLESGIGSKGPSARTAAEVRKMQEKQKVHLKLKFRLSKQDKMCQTDDAPPDPADFEVGCFLGHAVLCEFAFNSGLDMNLWSETGTCNDSEIEKLFLGKDLLKDEEVPPEEALLGRFGRHIPWPVPEMDDFNDSDGMERSFGLCGSFEESGIHGSDQGTALDQSRLIGGLELPPPPPSIGVDDEDIAIWRNRNARGCTNVTSAHASELLLQYVGSMSLLSPSAQRLMTEAREEHSRQPWSPAAAHSRQNSSSSAIGNPAPPDEHLEPELPSLTPVWSLQDQNRPVDTPLTRNAQPRLPSESGTHDQEDASAALLLVQVASPSFYDHGAGLTPPPTPEGDLTPDVPQPPDCWNQGSKIVGAGKGWPQAAAATHPNFVSSAGPLGAQVPAREGRFAHPPLTPLGKAYAPP